MPVRHGKGWTVETTCIGTNICNTQHVPDSKPKISTITSKQRTNKNNKPRLPRSLVPFHASHTVGLVHSLNPSAVQTPAPLVGSSALRSSGTSASDCADSKCLTTSHRLVRYAISLLLTCLQFSERAQACTLHRLHRWVEVVRPCMPGLPLRERCERWGGHSHNADRKATPRGWCGDEHECTVQAFFYITTLGVASQSGFLVINQKWIFIRVLCTLLDVNTLRTILILNILTALIHSSKSSFLN